jgi:DNA (cytosine-5)-methyltransferase 1
MNAANYGVPQDRKRVIIVGVRKDICDEFCYPAEKGEYVSLSQSIGDLRNNQIINVNRHEKVNNDVDTYLEDSWSSQFMSRNRIRTWDEVSYTVPATGRQVPLHPQAPRMVKISPDTFQFIEDDGSYSYNGASLYRRLTIHECARIQTFPDTYKLYFDKVEEGYKILGNAVPVKLAECVADSVKKLIQTYTPNKKDKVIINIRTKNVASI